MTRRVVQQTPKGKIARQARLIVVGNGNGLVGYGYAKSGEASPGKGSEHAFIGAVRSMDFVERFEDRTIWTEMHGKLGATRIILRPRPVGFGLHCNPYIHQICKAAGIKDISAKVWGSRTPINVIKLTFRMLQAGNQPQGMGNGIGGPARKLDKGSGMRGRDDIQRERGRKILDLRLR
ncbi:ribosomal protein S5 domain 2-type protein [Vararia minispora EC-137]|uniref:Ribosomal protein S5 domain 2-type protein n=1 Tax=Vararia minispora EC-137 TaxID=1314806 RepID=A0ACB8QLZ2_9AGAM|nr:ribosomal protein S5 domain 2-type protein [Vararia minispora EC-137]